MREALRPLISLWILAVDGFGLYFCNNGEDQTAKSVVFIFETGELWSVDTLALGNRKRVFPFLEEYFVHRFKDYSAFLNFLGLQSPYRWVCGITGTKGYQLQMATGAGQVSIWDLPNCVSNSILADGLYDEVKVPARALLPFFDLIFNKCGVARPAHLELKGQ